MSDADASRVAFRASMLIVAGMVGGMFLFAALGVPGLDGGPPPWTVARVFDLWVKVGGGLAIVVVRVLLMFRR